MKKKITTSKKQTSPEQFLSEFPETIQTLANRLRQLIKATIPQVGEKVYPGWKLLGYRLQQDKGAYFCFIAPKSDAAYLGFEYGIMLSDPHHLLGGEGKQVRHVCIKSEEDIQSEFIAQLIQEAADLGKP